ncbi:hypothetical protein PHYBLDRAFT_79620 [Phycomyces blakesleeanus NRRL 1555(-)]|uniref:F-box domain-containing protein n=1 Tax=Phycomyces blakesleeanus (strain ATCC 8743b / DSM 1359 / FGSC 10004 / NBRC 33097 / NRRL 1555) TaxID=763407 RepID=A0A163BFT5_PHYB8|nr:hypothetical protein PHYBLDRAFT_79620 [Phycomyces blakesleeanus NRRL 1555(-)]OAD81321.1 hypothetical protein PHYBLDRAFT_79620 [Phycomyces blakesleeanus NRRL 1555(-)]|eukprot:XP_018299361.1 hypothetical protein PHYBLDRAFT_79620 [Phycomyces blakesleeanus NRRL 1555(-)]
MIPDLPTEILAYVAKYLLPRDKLTCTHVCKAWSKPFQASLWSVLRMEDLDTLNTTYDLPIEENVYIKNGDLVRELDLATKTDMDDEQLLILQEYFPYLRDLKITTSYKNIFEYRRSVDWSLWQSLDALKLNISIPDFFEGNREFLYILSCLPCLRQLDISLNDQQGVMILELNDIETLHRNLPRLEVLSMKVILNHLASYDLMVIETCEPAIDLKSISVTLHGIDYRWLCYFSRKYPNLQTIELKTARHVTEIGVHEEQYLRELKRRFISCYNVFERLENIQIDTKDLGELHKIFWTLFGPSDIPSRSIKVGFNSKYSSLDVFDETMKMISTNYSATVESLSIAGKFGSSDQPPVLLGLDEYARLTQLDLKCSTAKFELDLILDCCIFLEKLRITESGVTFSEKASIHPPAHGLRLIEFNRLTLSTTVLRYISRRCTALRLMRIVWTVIYQEAPAVPYHMPIDMSHTHFEELRLHCVKFITMHPSTLSLPIRLISISPERFRGPTSLTDEGVIDFDHYDGNNDLQPTAIEDEDYANLSRTVWYHMYWDIGLLDGKYHTASILRDRQVAQVLYYLSSICLEDRYSSIINSKLSPSSSLRSNSLEAHTPLGYVDFRCGSIGKVYVDTNSAPEDDYWQTLR